MLEDPYEFEQQSRRRLGVTVPLLVWLFMIALIVAGMMQCAHCDMTTETMRQAWPYQVRVVATNPYGVPVGKIFPWARVFTPGETVEVSTGWPALFHGSTWVFETSQVELLTP